MAPTLITVTLPLLLKNRPLISSFLLLLLLYFTPVLLTITLLCGLALFAYSVLSSSSSSSSSSGEKKKEKENGNTTWLGWIEGLDKSGRSWIEKKLKEEGIPLSDRPNLETLMDLIQSSFGDVLAINPLQFNAHNPATKDSAAAKIDGKHVTFASQITLSQSPSARNPKVSDGLTVELVKESVKKNHHHHHHHHADSGIHRSERTPRSLAIRPDNQVADKARHLKLPHEDDDLAGHRARKTQSPRNPSHGDTILHHAEETLAPMDNAARRSPASKIPIAENPAKKNRTPPKILSEDIGQESGGAMKKIPGEEDVRKGARLPKKIPSDNGAIAMAEKARDLGIPLHAPEGAGIISKIPRNNDGDIDRTKQGMSSKTPFVNDVTESGISSKIRADDVTELGISSKIGPNDATELGISSKIWADDVTELGISSKIRAGDVTELGISSKIRADDVTELGISSKIRADNDNDNDDDDDDDGSGIAEKGMFPKVPIIDQQGTEKTAKAPMNLAHSPVATTPPRFASILPKTSPASKLLEVSRRIFQKDDSKVASRMMPSPSPNAMQDSQSSSKPSNAGAASSNKGFSMKAPSSRKILEACRMFSSPKDETKVLGTMPSPRVSMDGSPKGVDSRKKADEGNKATVSSRVSGNKLQHKLLSRSLKGEVCASESKGNAEKRPFVTDGEKLDEGRDGLVASKKPSPNARNGKRERT